MIELALILNVYNGNSKYGHQKWGDVTWNVDRRKSIPSDSCLSALKNSTHCSASGETPFFIKIPSTSTLQPPDTWVILPIRLVHH